jgi:hypothetical protein
MSVDLCSHQRLGICKFVCVCACVRASLSVLCIAGSKGNIVCVSVCLNRVHAEFSPVLLLHNNVLHIASIYLLRIHFDCLYEESI